MSIAFPHDKQRAKTRAEELLELLQGGPKTTAELVVWNHRFSASVRLLRERGYQIHRGTTEHGEILWTLHGRRLMVEVTDEMKSAYYLTPHWRAKRQEVLRRDKNTCVFCPYGLRVEVHHWRYELFNEDLRDLTTVCEECHRWIHENEQISIHFPHYVTPEIAARILDGGDSVRA